MIKVNLLPSAGRKSERGAAFDFGGFVSSATSGVKDKFLIGAVATVSVVVLTVALLFTGQQSKERTLVERERKAIEDSTRFKVVLAAKAKAEAARDSLYQQVAIIKSIFPCCRNWMRFDATTGTSSSLTPRRFATSAARSGSKPMILPEGSR